MILRGSHYATGRPAEVAVEGGRIVSVGPPTGRPADREAGWLAPALFDLQVNGCDGVNFGSADLTVDQVRHVVARFRDRGVAGLLPTLVTAPFGTLRHALRTIAHARESDPAVAAAVPGVHLEGPWISPEDGYRGAHPRDHVRPPDLAEFGRLQEAAGGLVRLVTLAPEVPGAVPFVEALVARGVVVALGHTAADGAVIRDAVRAGARLSTHLGNGCPAVLPRHANPLWEQLACDGLWASVITDGQHLPPAVVKAFVRGKTPARTVITSDAGGLAGCPPGRYEAFGAAVEVLPEGRIVVAGTPYLAGSWAFTDACVGPAVRDAGVTMAEAIDMAALRPRELLGLPLPRIEAGAAAELVLFDWADGGMAVRAVVGGLPGRGDAGRVGRD